MKRYVSLTYQWWILTYKDAKNISEGEFEATACFGERANHTEGKRNARACIKQALGFNAPKLGISWRIGKWAKNNSRISDWRIPIYINGKLTYFAHLKVKETFSE